MKRVFSFIIVLGLVIGVANEAYAYALLGGKHKTNTLYLKDVNLLSETKIGGALQVGTIMN